MNNNELVEWTAMRNDRDELLARNEELTREIGRLRLQQNVLWDAGYPRRIAALMEALNMARNPTPAAIDRACEASLDCHGTLNEKMRAAIRAVFEI